MSTERAFIGCDLGLGGGDNAKELPCPPHEILLIEAKETYAGGEGYRYGNLEIWGLDPRLTVAVAFYRTPNPNRTTMFAETAISATIAAYPLCLSKAGEVRYGRQLPTDLFLGGGVIGSDYPNNDDGCELETAMQGIRFNLTAIRTGATTHDIVCAIQARPNVSLGCNALAEKLIAQLIVKVGPVGKF